MKLIITEFENANQLKSVINKCEEFLELLSPDDMTKFENIEKNFKVNKDFAICTEAFEGGKAYWLTGFRKEQAPIDFEVISAAEYLKHWTY